MVKFEDILHFGKIVGGFRLQTSDEDLVRGYTKMLELPIVQKPRYIHGSLQFYGKGERIKPKRSPNYTHPDISVFEEIMEDVRGKYFPSRPPREHSVFLSPGRSSLDNLHDFNKHLCKTYEIERKLPRPEDATAKLIRDVIFFGGTLPIGVMPLMYAADVPENTNVFYGSNALMGFAITNLYQLTEEAALEIAFKYWRKDMREVDSGPHLKERDPIEILVEGEVPIVGIKPYKFA